MENYLEKGKADKAGKMLDTAEKLMLEASMELISLYRALLGCDI